MKTLLVLRHAKSDWSNANQSDYDRTLNARGHRTVPRMGEKIAEHDLTPDLIVASSAMRAKTTAELVAISCGYEGTVEYTQHFYLAPPDAYIQHLNNLANDRERVMVVGHNPGMESLIHVLTGEFESMPTCALAVVTLLVDSWSDLTNETTGELVSLWRPKEVLE